MDMDDDDEFGDLYTDVLRPLSSNPHPSVSNPSPNPASITGSDVTPVGNPNSDRPIDALAIAPGEDVKDDWLPDNWNDDGDDIPVANFIRNVEPKVLEVRHGGRASGSVAEDAELLVVQELRVSEEDENIKIADLDQEPVIPGISTVPLSTNAGMRVSNSEDWDSDSEDDLQIVLNDNSHGPRIGERNVEDEDDEDGEEDLVIVTDEDQQHHLHPVMEEQEWADGELQPAAEGERKDNSDAAKANGAVGNTAGPTRTGYSIHGFNPQHHSMFKYVRPGAPVASVITPTSQIRPPTVGSVAGRGRGDWRPAGIRPGAPKNYHSGFASGWANSSSRPFGGGLDFTLPSHKTVFDVDIESFEEKPWKYPGVDISDYFNFGLDEENWKEYCKQLDQLRVESTMQSKIRVYESGRSEQEYDPDLPPELAAATGHHDISSDIMHHVKIDNGQSDISGQGRGAPFIRAPFPPGRAIQVETSYVERLPSIDTRPPRTRDADAIIEIVLQDPMNDSLIHNGSGDQTEKDTQEEHRKDIHDAEGDRTEVDYSNRCPQTSNGRPRKVGSRRIPYASERDDTVQFSPDSPPHYHPNTTQSPIDRAGSFSSHRGGRLTEGSSRGRYSSVDGKHSNYNNIIPAQSSEANQHGDDSDDRPSNSTEHNRTPQPSSPIEAENAGDLSLEQRDGEHEDMLALGDDIDVEETSEFRISGETLGEDSMIQYPKKQKLSSRVEQAIVQDNDGGDGDLRATHSESSRAKSGSSNRKQRESDDEEVQGGRSGRAGDVRRRHEEKEPILRRKDDYGREGKYETERNHLSSRGHEPIYNSYTHKDQKFSSRPIQGRSEGLERPRETDCSLWQRKEDLIHSRRIKDEDIRLGREDVIHNRRIKDEGIIREETGLRNRSKFRVADRDDGAHSKKRLLDDGDWRGRSREGGPRLRERDDVLSRGEASMDEHQVKRRRNEEEYLKMDRASREDSLHSSYKAKEESSRRKRERDDYADPKREDSSRVRDKAMADDHYSSKHKDESWRQREKDDKQWLKQTLEDSPLRRDREEALRAGARNKSDPKVLIPDKDFQRRDRGRHTDHLKRRDRDRVSEEKYPQRKGREDVDAREKHYSNEERTSRHQRLSTHSDHVSTASDNQQISRERHGGEIRKGKDTEGSGQNTTGHGRRKHEEFISHRNEKVSSERTHSKNVNEDQAHFSEKQQEEEVASDDESKRGRSKLERWTSHKERDYNYSAEDNNSLRSASSSRAKAEKVEAGDTGNVLTKTEANDGSDSDVKGAAGDGGQIAERSEDDRGGDRKLDTFAKLKRRSERFKLPMPVDKDVVALVKRSENEAEAVQLTQNEAPADAEAEAIKPERPARKRRWTSS